VGNPFERLMETRGGQRLLGVIMAVLGAGLAGGAFAMLESQDEYFVVMPFVGSLGAFMGLGVLAFPGLGRVRGKVLRPSPWIFGLSLLASVIYGLWFLDWSGFGT
jgi:hypothetical protein